MDMVLPHILFTVRDGMWLFQEIRDVQAPFPEPRILASKDVQRFFGIVDNRMPFEIRLSIVRRHSIMGMPDQWFRTTLQFSEGDLHEVNVNMSCNEDFGEPCNSFVWGWDFETDTFSE